MTLLGVVGYRGIFGACSQSEPERHWNVRSDRLRSRAALGCAPLFEESATSLLLITFLAVVSPLVLLFPRATHQADSLDGHLACAGSLYLGLPIYSAVATRSSSGTIDAPWLSEAARRLAGEWDPAPRGLAWVLTVVLAIWVGDSVALFAGRRFGRLKLAPTISPNKSREGAFGGIIASMVVGAVSFQTFGLGDWWVGLVAGAAIGLAGQIGDLAESVLKRQAGVKDSGSVVPGHGGILDRIDALLFALPAGFLMAVGLERFGT